MKNKLIILASFIMILMIGFSAYCERNKAVLETDFGSYKGVDWSLTNIKGELITLSDFQGRPTMLVFWATWCPYCKKLLPGIERLHQKYNAKGLKILGVNIKEDGKPEVYWKKHDYHFDTVINGDDVAKLYGVRGTPSIVFISPTGKVLGTKSFSDPNHPLLEKFALEGIASMKVK